MEQAQATPGSGDANYEGKGTSYGTLRILDYGRKGHYSQSNIGDIIQKGADKLILDFSANEG